MKLHGLNISNYNNVVKLCLLEKGLPFEEVQTRLLSISPMGKIPVLEDEGHFISESHAILRYLELKHPEPSLFPTDPLTAARALEIHSMIDLYVDPVARTLLAAAFFGEETTPEAIATVSSKLARAIGAINRLVVFKPFIVGDRLTHADLSAVNTLPLTTQIMKRLGAEDPCAGIKGLADYLAMMHQRSSVQKVMSDRAKAMAGIVGA